MVEFAKIREEVPVVCGSWAVEADEPFVVCLAPRKRRKEIQQNHPPRLAETGFPRFLVHYFFVFFFFSCSCLPPLGRVPSLIG